MTLPSGNGQTTADKSVSVVLASDSAEGAATTPADAVTNVGAASGFVQAFLSAFNGTTWDRVRAGVTAVGSVFTGMLNMLPVAIFHTAPVTRTDGQGAPLEADATGNLQVNLATRLAGENIAADRMVVEGEWTYATITTGTTMTLKSGAGVLHSVTVCKAIAAATIDAYDNTAGSGVKIIPTITYGAAILTDPPLGGHPLDVQFSNGLTFVTSAATFIVVVYR